MQEKIKKFVTDEKFVYWLMLSGALILLIAYTRNILQINTVWELVDEYGYLANAAYLSGTDWSWLTNNYYGYGYSIWLVPLFWICRSGTRMIQGANLLNAMCVVGTFFIQNILMFKICKNLNRNIVVIISFVICFYPYLFAAEMKVLPECLLTCMIWICGLLLYLAFDTQKWYYYMLTAVAVVYTFFVHTRALVFCAAVILILVLMTMQKKVGIKNFLIFSIVGGVLFILGYVLKNQIIDAVYSVPLFDSAVAATEETKVSVGNVVTLEYMLKRILSTFTNFSIWHIYSFACKNFYLLVSTAGMFHIGIYFIIRDIGSNLKQKHEINSIDAIKLLYGVSAIVMILALIIQNPGNLEKPAYFFYGRYYEYLVGPIFFIGLEKCMTNRLHIVEKIIMFLGFVLSAWGTLALEKHLKTGELYFDSNRIASFSYSSYEKITYGDVIWYWIGISAILLVLIYVFNYYKKTRWLILVALLVLFGKNDKIIQGNILNIHKNNTDFYEIATFIHSNYDVEQVYFLKRNFVDSTAYAGVQSLLGKEKLMLIECEDIDYLEAGDILVTYSYNPLLEKVEKPMEIVGTTKGYAIYFVQ